MSFFISNISTSYADTSKEIEKANKKGNVVLLVVTEKGNSQNSSALEMARKVQKSHSKSAVIELDKANSTNAALVKKYGIAGAPAPLILADEPTGNLDPSLAIEILEVLKKINLDNNITIAMVTHSPTASDYGNIKIHIDNGQIVN